MNITSFKKNLINFILPIVLTISTFVSGQNNHFIKQKENITTPELFVITDEFNSYFSGKNKI